MQYFGFDRPSFGIKTYGFGVSKSKISADFTTGTYNSNGAAKTFKDLFTFNRAGKAWLVKDTGLQEYAADVPRLDNGLLIEQSATNALYYSSDISRWNLDGNTATKADNIGYEVSQTGAGGISSTSPSINSGDARVLSAYVKKTTEDNFVTLSGRNQFITRITATINTRNGEVTASNEVTDITVVSQGDYYQISFKTTNIGSPPVLRLTKTNSNTSQAIAGIFTVGLVTHELGTVYSSFILTEATPVTRPADFLLNNITGTTVTGNWDSTLTLSIVAGNLVHSGYGRIRSLEIN